jgi:AraC-like DNA-binding protein
MQKWVLKKIYALKNPIVFHLNDEEYVQFINLFDLLNKELVEKHPNNLETTSLLCELIYTYFFRLDKSEETKSESVFANRIMYFLQHDNHFTQKVTLQEIADYAGYSKFYTSTMFHKLYGITIQQFIINLRIEYAKKLINKTDFSITEIALECGFYSSSNFYLQFTKIVGDSPLQYKKKMKGTFDV